MKNYISFFLSSLLLASCTTKGTTSQSEEDKSDSIEVNNRNEYTKNNIQSYDILEYKYKFGKIDLANSEVKYSCEYDIEGNLIAERDLFSVVKNRYNDTILIESVSYRLNGNIEKKECYTYENNLRIDSIYNEAGFYSGKQINYVDKLGRDSLSIEYNKSDKPIGRYTKIYDSIGVKEFSWINLDDNSYRYFFQRVNDDKLVQKFVEKNKSGKILCEDTQYYNENNLLESYVRYNYDGGAKTYVKSKYYYVDGTALIKERIFYQESGEPTHIYMYKYAQFAQ